MWHLSGILSSHVTPSFRLTMYLYLGSYQSVKGGFVRAMHIPNEPFLPISRKASAMPMRPCVEAALV